MASIKEYSDLHGHVAIITGGAGYLGRTMAHTLAEAGANIAIVDIRLEAINQICADLEEKWGIRTCGLVVDLEKEDEVRAIPGKVVEALGRIDILINNAAFVGTSDLSGWGVPFDEQETPTWRRALEVNLTAVFELTQACVPYLRKSGQGCIVNIASIYGVVGPDPRLYEGLPKMFNPAAYAASKGGIVQFTKWCATVLAPEIRVNAITPGGIFRNQNPLFLERYESRCPMKRMAREDDFIGATLFLASRLSKYITGQNIIVDGGFSVW